IPAVAPRLVGGIIEPVTGGIASIVGATHQAGSFLTRPPGDLPSPPASPAGNIVPGLFQRFARGAERCPGGLPGALGRFSEVTAADFTAFGVENVHQSHPDPRAARERSHDFDPVFRAHDDLLCMWLYPCFFCVPRRPE